MQDLFLSKQATWSSVHLDFLKNLSASLWHACSYLLYQSILSLNSCCDIIKWKLSVGRFDFLSVNLTSQKLVCNDLCRAATCPQNTKKNGIKVIYIYMSLESCLFKCYNNPRDVCKTSARHRSSLLYLTENCFYHPDLDRQLVKRCISHEWEKISFEELEQFTWSSTKHPLSYFL